MKENKPKKKAMVLLVAMTALLSLPLTMNAQYDEGQYGLQPWFGSSLLGKGESTDAVSSNGMMGRGGSSYGADIYTQEFGSTPGAGINVEDFGTTPLGSGVFVLLAAGAGYAALKRRKNETNTTNNN